MHPNYIGTIVVDRSAFDLHNCPELKAAPFITEQPRRITIYEDEKWQLIGITIPNFWRKTVVPVRVGDKTESGAQLLQLWTRANDRAEEVLVLYPQDGYWRARPLPPKNLSWSAYGSSFLVGPIEMKERPIVDIKEVVFDPATQDVPPGIHARRLRDAAAREARHRQPGARCDARSAGRRRPAVRGAALDVRHRDQQRRRAPRLAREGREDAGSGSC